MAEIIIKTKSDYHANIANDLTEIAAMIYDGIESGETENATFETKGIVEFKD